MDPSYSMPPAELQVCGQSFGELITMDGRNESFWEASSSKYDDAWRYVWNFTFRSPFWSPNTCSETNTFLIDPVMEAVNVGSAAFNPMVDRRLSVPAIILCPSLVNKDTRWVWIICYTHLWASTFFSEMGDAQSIQVPNQYPISNGWAPLPIYGPCIPQGQAEPIMTRPLSVELPGPAPEITKKTRGRKVPTTATEDPRRKWKCVECSKMFIRREHLKRHRGSIHKEISTLSFFSTFRRGTKLAITF